MNVEKQLEEISCKLDVLIYKLDVLIENIKNLDNRLSEHNDMINAINSDVGDIKKGE